MRSLLLNILLYFSFTTIGGAQASVVFTDISLDRALDRAAQSKKYVFVDTYAPWCIPCKKMAKEFRDKDLAKFFNKNFVNLKVNMDNPSGKEMYRMYQIVFLPTLLILDTDGNVMFKVDRAMSAKELLNVAKQVVSSKSSIAHYKPQTKPTQKAIVTNSPKNKPKTKPRKKAPIKKESLPITTQEEEKILYVLDSDSKVPPEVLYEEAYFRMQLMDNSHRAVVEEYLDSQTDWKTEKNMIFIYDFLFSTESRAFKFFIKERSRFEKRFGKESVAQTIEILVDERLQRGFPRPTLEESIALIALVDKEQSEIIAYEYFLERLYTQGDFVSYEENALNYLEGPGVNDHQVLYRLVELKLRSRKILSRADYKQCLKWISKALKVNNKNYKYWDTQAYLFYKLTDKKNALKSNEQSIYLAKSYNQDTEELMILNGMIRELN